MNSLRLPLLFTAALLTSVASAATLTLTTTADTFVRADSPSSVAGGTAAELLVGQLSGTQAMHGLLTFDLSSIPVNATIDSVSLVLKQSSEDGSSAVTTVTLNLYQLTEAFVESQASWNNRATGTAWATAGGTFDSTVLSSASLRTRPSQAPVLTLPVDQTWASTSGFVAAVQSAADGSNSISFLLKDADESNAARELIKFFGKEGTTSPQLIVNYTSAIPEPSTVAFLSGVIVLVGAIGFRRRSGR